MCLQANYSAPPDVLLIQSEGTGIMQDNNRRSRPAGISLRGITDTFRSLTAADPERECLQQISDVLLLCDGELCHLSSGSCRAVQDEDDPASLAAAAHSLLDRGDQARGRRKQAAVLLLLPVREFMATRTFLPGVAPQAVPAALQLQVDSLLPGHTGELALAVHPGRNPDEDADTALWMPAERLDELHRAFAGQGIQLAAVTPRILALVQQERLQWVEDSDTRQHHCLLWQNGAIRQLLQVDRRDLEEEAFQEQWQAAVHDLRSRGQAATASSPPRSAATFIEAIRQPLHPEYCFVPQAARQRRQRLRGQRLRLVAAALVLAAGLAVMLPYLWQGVQILRLEARLDTVHEQATDARENQARVREFENRWALFRDYPEQEILPMMLDLQNRLQGDRLIALTLEDGRLSIEGESNNPQALLQRLEEHERFAGVDFSRATSNNRYYIDMRLAGIDFASYYDWYFPDRRRR